MLILKYFPVPQSVSVYLETLNLPTSISRLFDFLNNNNRPVALTPNWNKYFSCTLLSNYHFIHSMLISESINNCFNVFKILFRYHGFFTAISWKFRCWLGTQIRSLVLSPRFSHRCSSLGFLSLRVGDGRNCDW